MIVVEVKTTLRDYSERLSETHPIDSYDYIVTEHMETQSSAVHEGGPAEESRVKYLEDIVTYVFRIPEEDRKKIEKKIGDGKKLSDSTRIILSVECNRYKTMLHNTLGSMGSLFKRLLNPDENESVEDLKSSLRKGSSVESLHLHGIAIKEYIFRKTVASMFDYARTGNNESPILSEANVMEELRNVIRPENITRCRRSIGFTDIEDDATMDLEFTYHWDESAPKAPIVQLKKATDVRLCQPFLIEMSSLEKSRRKEWLNSMIDKYPSLGRGWTRESDLQLGALDAYMQLPDELKDTIGKIS